MVHVLMIRSGCGCGSGGRRGVMLMVLGEGGAGRKSQKGAAEE